MLYFVSRVQIIRLLTQNPQIWITWHVVFIFLFQIISTFSCSLQMIDTVTGAGVQSSAAQLKTLIDLEARYQPKLSGLRLIECAQDNGLRMTAKLRELEVKDLLSLSRFFGFSAETFSLAVSLLDRFLSVMKVCNETVLACFMNFYKLNKMTRLPFMSISDSAKAPLLCWSLLLLHRYKVLRGGEKCASGKWPHPHQSESLHCVWYDEDGEDRHGEIILEGESPHNPPLSSTDSQSYPGAAWLWGVT